MNTKLSGAQLVLVPIQRVGRNYLPFVEYIDHKLIKYIDFCPADLLPDTDEQGCPTSQDLFITIFDERGTQELHRNLPLDRLNYISTLGTRQPIFNKVNLTASYIDCQDGNLVGKTVALVFWYDLPNYSSRNTSDTLLMDSISVPITNIIRYNQLPDIDRLTGKRFRKILLGTPTTTPDLNQCVSPLNMYSCYLTLQKGAYKVLSNVPIALLYQLQMLDKSEFQNIIFDLQSSYITIGGAGTATAADFVGKYIFFNVQYEG